MHYEKKDPYKSKYKNNIDKLALTLLATAMIIFTVCIHAPIEFWWPIKFFDVVNVIAQIATAAAFFLAIHQYRKNSEMERQKVLIDESKILIEKMKKNADDYSQLIGPSQYASISEAAIFMQKISNHAGNFNAIFLEINEGIQKAIIRMHWQDLYFVNLNNAMENFNIKFDLTDYGVGSNTNIQALAKFSAASIKSHIPLPPYARYLQLQYIASIVKGEIDANKEIRTSLFVFEKLFFDNDALRDHLYGSMNIIDIRVRAPLVAVLNEHFMGTGVKRDPLAFKKIWPS